jgi:hypothetical protein
MLLTRGRCSGGPKELEWLLFYVQDFKKLRKNKGRVVEANNVRWKAPPEGIYKMTLFSAASGSGGWGFMARDYEGVYLEAGYGNLPHVANQL